MTMEKSTGIDVRFEAHDYRCGPWVAMVATFVGIWTFASTSLWILEHENLRMFWFLIPVIWFLGLFAGVVILVVFSNLLTQWLQQELKKAYGRSSAIFSLLLTLLAYFHLQQFNSIHQILGWTWIVGLVIGIIGNKAQREAHFRKCPPCPVDLQGTSR